MRQTGLIALLLAGSLAAAAPALGDSLGMRMDVSANVITNCRLVIPPLSFGTYDPLDAHSAQPADASVNLTLNCTRNTAASISFDFGLHPSTGTARGMNGPSAEVLQYQIYRDSARSQIWAQGSDSFRILTHGVASPDQLTVFGRIPPRQEVEPGAYTDVLTATVDF
jgi:spore coat protein U-like protein